MIAVFLPFGDVSRTKDCKESSGGLQAGIIPSIAGWERCSRLHDTPGAQGTFHCSLVLRKVMIKRMIRSGTSL